jgi:hypothetical protein
MKQESNISNELLVLLAKRLLVTKGDKYLSVERLKETAYSLAEEVLQYSKHGSL